MMEYIAGALLITLVMIALLLFYFQLTKNPTTPITPIMPPVRPIGGCAGTRWGCCPDGLTSRADPLGTNCGQPSRLIGGCAGTRWGCCPNGVDAKRGPLDTC